MGKYCASAENESNEGVCMLSLHSEGNVNPDIVGVRIKCVEEVPADQNFEFAVFELTDEGAGGTAVEITKLGQCAAPVCNALAGTFSTQPAKLDADKRMATYAPHRRAAAIDKDAPGDGISLSGVADGRGVGIFCIQAPVVATFRFELIYRE